MEAPSSNGREPDAPEAPQALCEAARAKVNLFLHVMGRRPDGYHLLDSLAVFPEAGDVLCAAPAATLRLDLAGPFAGTLQAEPDNLVLRAARALAEATGVPARAHLTLDKRLPVASGIGGGSADAAAALRLLCRLWSVAPEPDVLTAIAAGLGADIPVCLHGRPAVMGGVGEILTPAPRLPACGMVLVNPGLSLATPAVFRARTGDFSAPARLPEGWDTPERMAADLALLSNDLQAPAIALCPDVAAVLSALRAAPGCLLARMSGSGATCFGLFRGVTEARLAVAAIARPGWWCWGGALAG